MQAIKKFLWRQFVRLNMLLFLAVGIFLLSPDLQRQALQGVIPSLLDYHQEVVSEDLEVKEKEMERMMEMNQTIAKDPYVDASVKKLARHRIQRRFEDYELERAALQSVSQVSRRARHTFEALRMVDEFSD